MAFQELTRIDVELTVALTAYTAGDVVGGLITFAIPGPAKYGFIHELMLVDEDAQNEGYKLWLFDAAPTTFADDAAYLPVVADRRKEIGMIEIVAGDYVAENTTTKAVVVPSDIILFTADDAGNIYGYLEATATPDYANTDALYIRLAMGVQRLK